jgi:CheY-like chemotaxis protein
MATSPLHVLVVEDHQNSRDLLCEMLGVLGHHAYCVSTAEAAVEPLKSGNFNVLIADINLPGMSGIDLAQMAVKNIPDLKVIFASGYGYLITDKTDLDFVLLPKPFNLAQLKRAINHL